MKHLEYFSKYKFDWDLFDMTVGGKSFLDVDSFMNRPLNNENTKNFLENYGLEQNDPILKAELFGNFQEAIQFIKRYFLREGNPDGLDFTIPNCFSILSEGRKILLMAFGENENCSEEESIWAQIIIKVMHTLFHVDKDLRHNYFSVIQQQIFDRFYKYLFRDKDNNLYLGIDEKEGILLHDFHTKAKKSRDSIVIKLLNKAENVDEELFDSVGVLFVTPTKFDILRVIKFLYEKNIIIPHNIKPSRSYNSLINLDIFRDQYKSLVDKAQEDNFQEEDFIKKANDICGNCLIQEKINEHNIFSSKKYQAIQFTCRQLIKYKNPFMLEISELKKKAKNSIKSDGSENNLAQKIIDLDVSLIAKDIRFFYPFELQITNIENYKINTQGEASHADYKKLQLNASMNRLFRPLIYYNKKYDRC